MPDDTTPGGAVTRQLPTAETVAASLEIPARAGVALTKAGALPTAAGAFIVFGYFAQIGYVPSLRLPDLLVFFIASAGIGTLLLVMLALIPWALGALWAKAFDLKRGPEKRSLGEVVGASAPFALLSFALPAALLLIFFSVSVYLDLGGSQRLYLMAAPIAFSFCLPLVWEREFGSWPQRIGWGTFVAAVAMLGNFVALIAFWSWLTTARQQLAQEDQWTQLAALILIATIIIAVAVVVMLSKIDGMWRDPDGGRMNRRLSGVLIPIGAVFLLFSLSGFGNINRSIMRALGIGGLSDVSLVFNEEGRDQIAALGYHCTGQTASGPCVVHGATVHLALGDELRLELPRISAGDSGEYNVGEGSTTSRRLTLSKAYVGIIER